MVAKHSMVSRKNSSSQRSVVHLVPPTAPFFAEADVLLAADCVAYAISGFHQRYLRVTEIMYHPTDPTQTEKDAASDLNLGRAEILEAMSVYRGVNRRGRGQTPGCCWPGS